MNGEGQGATGSRGDAGGPRGAGDSAGGGTASAPGSAVGGKRRTRATLPATERTNPYEKLEFDAVPVGSWSLQKTFKGHAMSISSIAVHPEKPIFATASDDTTWKMWSYPDGGTCTRIHTHKLCVSLEIQIPCVS